MTGSPEVTRIHTNPTAHRDKDITTRVAVEVDTMDSPSVPPRNSSDSSFRAEIASNENPRPADRLPEIKRSQGILDVLFESAPDAMLITDQDGRIREVNGQTETLFGYSGEELIGELIEKLIPANLRDAHRLHREVYQRAPAYLPMDRGHKLFALHKDGGEFPVEISVGPVVSESGMLFYSAIRDTSRRDAALQELRRRLNLEHALSGLSVKFINLPADRLDQEITSGLQVESILLRPGLGELAT